MATDIVLAPFSVASDVMVYCSKTEMMMKADFTDTVLAPFSACWVGRHHTL